MPNDDKVATYVNDILTRARKMTKFQTSFPPFKDHELTAFVVTLTASSECMS